LYCVAESSGSAFSARSRTRARLDGGRGGCSEALIGERDDVGRIGGDGRVVGDHGFLVAAECLERLADSAQQHGVLRIERSAFAIRRQRLLRFVLIVKKPPCPFVQRIRALDVGLPGIDTRRWYR